MADHPTVRIEAPQATPTTPRSMIASRPTLPRRQSRFTEDMTEDHTPAQSVYEHEASPSFITTSARGGYSSSTTTVPADAREYRPIELITRGMNGCTHGAACVILVAIMTEFLSQWEGFWVKQISEQAVALLVFLGVDTLLDIYSLIRLHEAWPAWALFIRLMNGIVYIAMFMIYIAHGRVFPEKFTFWAMSPRFAGPLVYIFLWLLGLWNLCHAALRRHRLGKGLQAYIHRSKPQLPCLRGHLPTREASNRHPRSPFWRRWIRVGDHDPNLPDIEVNAQTLGSRTTIAPIPPISLRERPAEMKKRSYPPTTRTVSTHSYNSKTEERVASGHEKEHERDHEKDKELEGGLSPPRPVKF